ncbi:hypothetical protein [Nocardiopsis sp. NPDC006832]|uniref:hypothetical protein n=1 Tax=Nocardiopsis sp. NPDC006832 TaxID=3157188 RepID=UPI0033F68F1E
MTREYGGDHVDLRNAEVGRDLIGKVEHHYHHPAPSRPAPLGVPVGDLSPADAHTFEVHEVADPTGGDELPPLPPYLYRSDVDDPLRAAVRDARNASGLVLLVGGSSVGKTRACWEAVHAELPSHWRLWHPLSPTRPEALKEALRADRVAPHTVVWLNEAQLYLREPEALEALQGLLADASRGPVLVLGSLWPEYWRELLDEASTGREGRHLLDRARDIIVPGSFTSAELRANADLSRTDRRLLWALREGDQGQVTQALSGALDLLRRYRHGTPVERAVLEVVMDASRLVEYGFSFPAAFLKGAAPGYLSPTERARLPDKWFTTVVESLTRRGPGTPGPLIPDPAEKKRRARYLLPDYLEEYGRDQRRHLCPPDSFWEALSGPAGNEVYTLPELARAAEDRLLLRHVDAIVLRDTPPFIYPGRGEQFERRARLRTRAGDHATAERLATDAALSGRPNALLELLDTADRPELTRAAFALLRRTESTDRVVEEIALRLHTASEERKRALARILEENTGPDGLRAMVELLRPLRDRTGIRLCLERIGPEEAQAAEAEQSAWEAEWDQRIDQAIENAKSGHSDPLDDLLVEDSHPLHPLIRVEIARRCVSAGVHEPILERTAPFHGPASPKTFQGWPVHPELLEALAECGDPQCLNTVAQIAKSVEAWDTCARFLELAVRAGATWRDLAVNMNALALSGRTEVVSRLLEGFTDLGAKKLALRLHLRTGDLAAAERLAFPEIYDHLGRFGMGQVQAVLIRHLRRRGDTSAAAHLARRSAGHTDDPDSFSALSELLTEQGRPAEAIEVLASGSLHGAALEEVVHGLSTEPVASEAAERMRYPWAPWRNGPLLTLLAWSAEAAGDDERARTLRPRGGELVDGDLLHYLSGVVLPTTVREGREAKAHRRESRALVRHLRHGTPLTLARHLAEGVDTVPGFTRRERWAADRPTHPALSIGSQVSRRYEGRLLMGVLLVSASQMYRIKGDAASADELEEASLRVGGSGAVPLLVRGHLASGEHARVRALLEFLGEEVADAKAAHERSRPVSNEKESLRHAQWRSYHLDSEHHAQRALVHLVRAGALHLADDIIECLAPASEYSDGVRVRFMSQNKSPVDPLLEAARPDLALVAVGWLREHRCHLDLSHVTRDLELEGDWDNAALFQALPGGDITDSEHLAHARALSEGGAAPDVSAQVALLDSHVRLAEERGDDREAERAAGRAALAGHGTVMEGLARRRIERGENVGRWRTVLERGLTPAGDPDPDWCEATKARGNLRPMVVDRRPMDYTTLWKPDGRAKVVGVPTPYTFRVRHFLLPLVLTTFAPSEAEAAILTTTAVSLSATLVLLPWLTADARRRWPLRAWGLTFLILQAVFWGPALVGVSSAAVAERCSPARALVSMVLAPLSLMAVAGFALFSTWLGTLGGAVMSLGMVYAFLALVYRNRRRAHHRYLADLRSEA